MNKKEPSLHTRFAKHTLFSLVTSLILRRFFQLSVFNSVIRHFSTKVIYHDVIIMTSLFTRRYDDANFVLKPLLNNNSNFLLV